VERHPKEMDWLNQNGGHLHGFILHGDLFFGTASSLLDEIRQFLVQSEILLIDLWQVRSVDASSIVILKKILRLAKENDTKIAVTGLQAHLSKQMNAFGLNLYKSEILIFKDLDYGLEWAETQLLNSSDSPLKIISNSEEISLLLGFEKNKKSENFASQFEIFDFETGQFLFKKGDPSDTLFLILKATASVFLSVSGSDYSKRLRSYGVGTILGEMGFYNDLPRSADVVSDSPTRVAVLTRESLGKLEVESPSLAREFHRFVINTLSARLRAVNEELRAAL
jgi:SulP family sulfate permease